MRRRWSAFVGELATSDAARHARRGHAGRLARPHLKEGRGGLRDAAALRWRGDDSDLRAEVGVLLAVRAALHDAASRAEDVLSPDYPEVYRHCPEVYEAARRIALAHRRTPPPAAGLLDLLRGDRDDALDALDHRPPDLPGWAGVARRPPANPLHVFAVDTHLVTAALEAAGPYDGFDADVFASLERPDLLLYGALLHDIGKGAGGDHSVEGAAIARRAAAALGLAPADAATIGLLVRHHLLLAEIATRRDLGDEASLAPLVVALGSEERLRLLYLLTRADARATAEGMWGYWRASLVREAFLKALELLRAPSRDRLDWRRAELRQVLARAHPVSLLPAIDEHLAGLPAAYLTAFRTGEQVEHFRLMHPAPQPGEVRLKPLQGPDGTTLIVTARDRPGLIASVAASLTVHGIDVLAARIFTRSDGVALESYRVVDAVGHAIAPEEWDRVGADVGRDVSADVERRAAGYARPRPTAPPPTVLVDNESSGFYTVIEVKAPDRIGLLARLTRALFELGLDVHVAKIVTEGDQAIDTFYVWEADDGRVDPARFAEVEAALSAAASPP